MNFWAKLGIFIAYTSLVAFSGWQACSWRDTAKQETAVVKQQDHVIKVVEKSNAITNRTEESHEKDLASIDAYYADGMFGDTGSMPAIPSSSCQPCSCRSAKYGLSRKQCDIEESKLIALWGWNKQQARLK